MSLPQASTPSRARTSLDSSVAGGNGAGNEDGPSAAQNSNATPATHFTAVDHEPSKDGDNFDAASVVSDPMVSAYSSDDFDSDDGSFDGQSVASTHTPAAMDDETGSGDDDDFDVEDDSLDDDDDDEDDDEVGGTAAGSTEKYASRLKNKEFRRLFSNSDVPAEELLFKLYGCALSKEILYQGKMFLTPRYLCFYSKLFNVTNKLIIPFTKITKIEPKMTMGIFPNAIGIHTTENERHLFTSFSNRNRTIDVLRQLRNGPPPPPQAELEPQHSGTTTVGRGVNGNSAHPSPSGHGPGSRAGDHGVRSSAGAAGASSNNVVQNAVAAVSSSFDEAFDVFAKDKESGAPKRQPSGRTASQSTGDMPSQGKSAGATSNGAAATKSNKAWPVDNIGPGEHAKTGMPEPAASEKVLATNNIAAPLGVVANLLFGKDTSWIKHFLLDVEHNRELNELPSFPELKNGAERYYEYVKPLSGPVGPKQTKCKSTEKIIQWDTNNYIEVITTTATPDVPSGSAFTTLTRAVLAWDSNNTTEIRLGTWLEWTGKTWLKGPIEKGAVDGQTVYCKDLVSEVTAKLSSGGSAGAAKGTTSPVTIPAASSSSKKQTQSQAAAPRAKEEPFSLPQVAGIFGISLGVIMLIFLFVHFLYSPRSQQDLSPRRDLQLVQQELELWQWIDDRHQQSARHDAKLTNSEIEAAIAATERKLADLKGSLCS